MSISEQLESDVIDYEPLSALHAGDKGLDIIRQLIVESSEIKGPNIRLVMEIGESQGDELDLLLRQNGFSEVSFSKDLCGRTRVVEAAKYNA